MFECSWHIRQIASKENAEIQRNEWAVSIFSHATTFSFYQWFILPSCSQAEADRIICTWVSFFCLLKVVSWTTHKQQILSRRSERLHFGVCPSSLSLSPQGCHQGANIPVWTVIRTLYFTTSTSLEEAMPGLKWLILWGVFESHLQRGHFPCMNSDHQQKIKN